MNNLFDSDAVGMHGDIQEEMNMRFVKPLLLTLLLLPILGIGTLSARQDMRGQKNGRNSDEWLKKEVRHELMMVPYYSVFDNLAYSINGSEVTLSGQVVQPTVKTDAENAVKHIEGVEKVNDQIEVLPPSPLDDQIRRAEYRAIYSQDLLSRYGVGNLQSIHIIVKGGHVTLEGSVDSQADKDAATLYAKGVPNVFSVDNHLQVMGPK
ncbi:MAG TPA: BON domain-containing protein [Candidatus Acidoferrales bacterium]|jgi:hyperosmotically inducible protein